MSNAKKHPKTAKLNHQELMLLKLVGEFGFVNTNQLNLLWSICQHYPTKLAHSILSDWISRSGLLLRTNKSEYQLPRSLYSLSTKAKHLLIQIHLLEPTMLQDTSFAFNRHNEQAINVLVQGLYMSAFKYHVLGLENTTYSANGHPLVTTSTPSKQTIKLMLADVAASPAATSTSTKGQTQIPANVTWHDRLVWHSKSQQSSEQITIDKSLLNHTRIKPTLKQSTNSITATLPNITERLRLALVDGIAYPNRATGTASSYGKAVNTTQIHNNSNNSQQNNKANKDSNNNSNTGNNKHSAVNTLNSTGINTNTQSTNRITRAEDTSNGIVTNLPIKNALYHANQDNTSAVHDSTHTKSQRAKNLSTKEKSNLQLQAEHTIQGERWLGSMRLQLFSKLGKQQEEQGKDDQHEISNISKFPEQHSSNAARTHYDKTLSPSNRSNSNDDTSNLLAKNYSNTSKMLDLNYTNTSKKLAKYYTNASKSSKPHHNGDSKYLNQSNNTKDTSNLLAKSYNDTSKMPDSNYTNARSQHSNSRQGINNSNANQSQNSPNGGQGTYVRSKEKAVSRQDKEAHYSNNLSSSQQRLDQLLQGHPQESPDREARSHIQSSESNSSFSYSVPPHNHQDLVSDSVSRQKNPKQLNNPLSEENRFEGLTDAQNNQNTSEGSSSGDEQQTTSKPNPLYMTHAALLKQLQQEKGIPSTSRNLVNRYEANDDQELMDFFSINKAKKSNDGVPKPLGQGNNTDDTSNLPAKCYNNTSKILDLNYTNASKKLAKYYTNTSKASKTCHSKDSEPLSQGNHTDDTSNLLANNYNNTSKMLDLNYTNASKKLAKYYTNTSKSSKPHHSRDSEPLNQGNHTGDTSNLLAKNYNNTSKMLDLNYTNASKKLVNYYTNTSKSSNSCHGNKNKPQDGDGSNGGSNCERVNNWSSIGMQWHWCYQAIKIALKYQKSGMRTNVRNTFLVPSYSFNMAAHQVEANSSFTDLEQLPWQLASLNLRLQQDNQSHLSLVDPVNRSSYLSYQMPFHRYQTGAKGMLERSTNLIYNPGFSLEDYNFASFNRQMHHVVGKDHDLPFEADMMVSFHRQQRRHQLFIELDNRTESNRTQMQKILNYIWYALKHPHTEIMLVLAVADGSLPTKQHPQYQNVGRKLGNLANRFLQTYINEHTRSSAQNHYLSDLYHKATNLTIRLSGTSEAQYDIAEFLTGSNYLTDQLQTVHEFLTRFNHCNHEWQATFVPSPALQTAQQFPELLTNPAGQIHLKQQNEQTKGWMRYLPAPATNSFNSIGYIKFQHQLTDVAYQQPIVLGDEHSLDTIMNTFNLNYLAKHDPKHHNYPIVIYPQRERQLTAITLPSYREDFPAKDHYSFREPLLVQPLFNLNNDYQLHAELRWLTIQYQRDITKYFQGNGIPTSSSGAISLTPLKLNGTDTWHSGQLITAPLLSQLKNTSQGRSYQELNSLAITGIPANEFVNQLRIDEIPLSLWQKLLARWPDSYSPLLIQSLPYLTNDDLTNHTKSCKTSFSSFLWSLDSTRPDHRKHPLTL